MKVGDLVKYVPTMIGVVERWKDHRGLIIRCIAGADKVKIVLWMNGDQQSIPERNLEVVNENK